MSTNELTALIEIVGIFEFRILQSGRVSLSVNGKMQGSTRLPESTPDTFDEVFAQAGRVLIGRYFWGKTCPKDNVDILLRMRRERIGLEFAFDQRSGASIRVYYVVYQISGLSGNLARTNEKEKRQ
jgi:hypothetical protein